MHGDLQTILRFHKDKYTVSSQPQSHLEMWEWGTSVRRKKGSIFILHLFCSLWHNFEEQMIELPKFLVQLKHNTVFQCCKVTSCLSILVLHVFNHSFKRIFAKYVKYTDLQSNFSDKNIWRSSKVFQGIAFPKFRGQRQYCNIIFSAVEQKKPIFHCCTKYLRMLL